MKKEPDKFEGLRKAKGNRFATILDSYVYIMAVLGTSFDSMEDDDGQWAVILCSENFIEEMELLAKLFGIHFSHLGLTDVEVAELSGADSIVVIEDMYGLVEVNFCPTFEEAWELMDELICKGIAVTKDTFKRLDATKPKKRKKSPKKKVQEEEQSYWPELIGANDD